MAADLARITYDPTRQYRSVITQQGRVTLEADNNEAAIIAGEALRLETIDIVGPTGTPDDGYKVGPGNGAGGVSIGPGTFYLGGWRLELDAAIDLSAQPDWLDMPPVAPAPPATTAAGVLGNRLVALLLTEQSVCAVEDQALREVALGGPDSAARARLMQQFLRLPLDGTTCPAGAAMISALLSAQGITIDPDTLQLMSAARLQAGFVPGPPATDPCTPAAAGGYLGADNQLVRVTVTAFDATAKTGTLLWGWNNASLLYRAKMTDPRTLTLTGTPVDEEHAPQLGQAVEILRSRANLGDGNFIAAPQGFVTTLTQAYSFDTGELQLAVALPAEYQADKNPLFVRLWQASVPFNAGQVTPLDATSGITVTITLPALPTSIALRPFWRFAVRPATPVNIYPQRYQETPQPPDGPRQWLADLAVVQAVATGSRLLADCRVPFLPLTQQSGACCGLVLGPKDVAGRGGLQAIMNKLAGTQSSVALLAGTYTLPAPLALGKQHSGLTLEACGPGVVLAANTANLAVFRFGLIVMDQASNVTLRGLSFTIPNVPQAPSRARRARAVVHHTQRPTDANADANTDPNASPNIDADHHHQSGWHAGSNEHSYASLRSGRGQYRHRQRCRPRREPARGQYRHGQRQWPCHQPGRAQHRHRQPRRPCHQSGGGQCSGCGAGNDRRRHGGFLAWTDGRGVPIQCQPDFAICVRCRTYSVRRRHRTVACAAISLPPPSTSRALWCMACWRRC